ncbi:MAG: GNAT family N-acetyltransferase [Peptostreptococcaceae bacterium]
MEKVQYRKIEKSDYEIVKKLICEAFKFNEFLSDKKVLDSILTLYLQGCIMDSSYSQVAVKDNKVIGIILGNSKSDKKKLRKFHNITSSLSSLCRLAFSSKANKNLLKEFTKIQNVYKEIIKGKENNFQGSVQLFIVSTESRGLGVGKTLMTNLLDYMKVNDVKSLYLYTDDRCNYGFYDSQNFRREAEKLMNFNAVSTKLEVYLYSYTF